MDAANPRALPALHRLPDMAEAAALRRAHPPPAVAAALLAELTGAEAAVVVSDAAAAMLLALAAPAAGGQAVVSRGGLVESGGLRIPDGITRGGARLVEVGTTGALRTALAA